jgi:hypothetical protein
LLWANLHSGYLLGVAILLVYMTGEGLALRLGWQDERSLSWPAIRWLATMTGVSFLAAAVNPNGPELWIYPFFTLGSNAMQRYIQEWASPDFHQVIFWPFAALLALGLLALVASRRRPSLTDGLLFAGAAAAGLLSARHIPIFAIVASPVICRHLLPALAETRVHPLLSGHGRKDAPGRLTVLNGLLLLLAIAVGAFWALAKMGGNDAAIAARYPVAAVDYLVASDLAGENGYNSYNWGGYLIWALYPEKPVFIDGRTDLYALNGTALEDYARVHWVRPGWEEIMNRYAIGYVVTERAGLLDMMMAEKHEWGVVHQDDLAVIYQRLSGMP